MFVNGTGKNHGSYLMGLALPCFWRLLAERFFASVLSLDDTFQGD